MDICFHPTQTMGFFPLPHNEIPNKIATRSCPTEGICQKLLPPSEGSAMYDTCNAKLADFANEDLTLFALP
jgi:hypothetical protein